MLQDCLQLIDKHIISNNDHEQHDHNNNNNQKFHANATLMIMLKSHLIMHSYYLEKYHYQHDSMSNNDDEIVALNMLQHNDQETPHNHFNTFIIKTYSKHQC